MSRVMNQLFLGSKIEEEIELSPESYLNLDPEYIEFTEKLEKELDVSVPEQDEPVF